VRLRLLTLLAFPVVACDAPAAQPHGRLNWPLLGYFTGLIRQTSNVRFGALADMNLRSWHVRFSLKSGHC
jgi:hypothetical protein